MLEKLGAQMIHSVTLAPLMQRAQEQMLEVMKQSHKLSENEQFNRYTSILSNLTRDAIAEQDKAHRLMTEFQRRASASGFKIFSDSAEEEAKRAKGLSGAIKHASQESIDLLAGQTNAVRVNQVEGLEISRNQLASLVSIDARLGLSNQLLGRIEEAIARRASGAPASDPLRAVGITRGA